MTTEEKFNAAVNVIRSLPKNGSYQPSNDLMLRFYGYFKQATIGPCTGRRPAFYDVVGRAKYDAWKRVGDMPKSVAMAKYVEELHAIVETMSYSDKVANFLEAPSNNHELESVNLDDLELVAGDVIERFRSHPNSPFASREASPIRMLHSSGESSPSPPEDSDHSDDEYIDTIEFPESKKVTNGTTYLEQNIPNGITHVSRSRTKSQSNVDISQEVSKAVQSLKFDVERLTNKIKSLENSSKRSTAVAKRSRDGIAGIPFRLLAFIIAWPFIATFIMNRYLYNRK